MDLVLKKPLQVITIVALMLLLTHASIRVGSSNEPLSGTFQGDLALPARSALTVSAWTFPWDTDGLSSLYDWSNALDEISPYWYWAFENGTVGRTHKDSESVEFVTFCRKNGISIIPMVSNNHNPEVVSSICRDLEVQKRHISELMNLTLRFNFEGIDINYESIRTEDRCVYSNFIKNLSSRLHSEGRLLSVSVFPKVADREMREGPDAYDYAEISRVADQVRVMAYNLHWSSCPMAGPIHSFEWVDDVLSYSASVIPPAKLMLGVPQFSYDWRVDKNGRALSVAVNRSYSEVMKLMAEYNAPREWDSIARTPFIEYKGTDGYLHSLHYCDRESLMHEMKLVGKHSLRGISVWKVGGEDPLSSDMIGSLKAMDLSDLPPFIEIGKDTFGTVGTPIPLGPVRAYDIEGRLGSIEWDLGDGNSSMELEPVHTYISGGHYTATFTVEDEHGNTASMSRSIRIGPYATFRLEGDTKVGSPFVLNGTGSWDPIGLVSYNWDLGDGTFRFHDTAVIGHTYSRPGRFIVSLTVISSKGYTDTERRTLDVPDQADPYANAGPDILVWEDSWVLLDGSSSRDDSGEMQFEWTISTGQTVLGIKQTLFLPDPGVFTAVLKVKDPSGRSDTDSIVITVRDRTPPVIDLKCNASARLGEVLILDASDSWDNVGIVKFLWDLGGGIVIEDTERVPLKLSEARRYFITLEVLDAEGNWNTTTVSVDSLDKNPPYAKLSIIPSPVPLGSTYLRNKSGLLDEFDIETFIGTIIREETYIFSVSEITDETEIASVRWEFGDGATAGGPIVYHAYKGSGLYRGSVEIEDIFNNSLVIEMLVLVVPAMERIESFHQEENITYLNTTVHIGPERKGAPFMDTEAVMVLCASALLVSVLMLDILGAIRSVRSSPRKKGPGGSG